jgi:hypothetical protein
MELLGALVVARRSGLTEENNGHIDTKTISYMSLIEHARRDRALGTSTR